MNFSCSRRRVAGRVLRWRMSATRGKSRGVAGYDQQAKRVACTATACPAAGQVPRLAMTR